MALTGANCDILFLSYSEPGAEENFRFLLSRFPRAKRLHGVVGMGRAYKMTAEVVDTPYYFIIDGDNELRSDFDFNSIDVPTTPNIIKIWSCENAVNGLIYGYGGVKLCSRLGMNTLKDDKLDVLGSGENQLIFDRKVASLTRFNLSPFDAWKAGFRECCMLKAGSGIDMPREKADAKIGIWMTKGEDKLNGKWAMVGASDGVIYAMQNKEDFTALKKIDDPRWLHHMFVEKYSKSQDLI